MIAVQAKDTWGAAEETEVNISEVQGLIANLADVKQCIELKKDELSEMQEEYDNLKTKILRIFDAHNLQKFDTEKAGVYIRRDLSVRLPQTEEDKQLFFGWLKERGIFDDYITVNSNSLKSLYKAEKALSEERGELEFSIPGISEVKPFSDLNVRIKKGET